ncbi:scavenger receptor class F member 2-like isoform X2 [Mya arenaria]|uniref:scavenger receptor class F member 2-like isoform X2 n=1 Tax=Mya arenaria TaxID=6604 RepID=UPI0022E02D17|nr:scavenger receptor class F member 2-like isoform X2 [Mya arenaria]
MVFMMTRRCVFLVWVLSIFGSLTLGCEDGLWGLSCSYTCAEGCQEVCHTLTGKCNCTDGFYGPRCDNTCGSGCAETCDKASEAESLTSMVLPLSVGAGALVVIAVLAVALACTRKRLSHSKRGQRSNRDYEVYFANSSTAELQIITKHVGTGGPPPIPDSSAYSEISMYNNIREGIGKQGYDIFKG